MTINPIAFAQDVNRQFLRYQLTAFPLSDPDMARQAKEMLTGESADSQLVKGPYVSLSRSFRQGKSLKKLVEEGRLHPAVAGIAEHPVMFAHQEAAFNAVTAGHHCLISTGTGSGKTEAFLYPILDHCFRLRDESAPHGIVAILVYPMNALAIDQLERLRVLLAGTGITYGLYVGSTSKESSEAVDITKMQRGEGRDKIPQYREKVKPFPNMAIAPWEERISETEMREDPPRILLTNVNQLEYLMTRGKDLGMFENAPLRFLVFDEAHTYTGARGAEVSVLIRRIRAFCNKRSDDVICIGTSATIVDPVEGQEAARKFAHRFFGVDPNNVSLVKEIYEEQEWGGSLIDPPPLGNGSLTLFEEAMEALREDDPVRIASVIKRATGQIVKTDPQWRSSLYHALHSNAVVKAIYETMSEPLSLQDAVGRVRDRLGRTDPASIAASEILLYMALGAAAEQNGSPLLRPQIHFFVRGLAGAAAILLPGNCGTEAKLFFSKQKASDSDPSLHPNAIHTVVTCPNCGQHYFELFMDNVTEDSGLVGGLIEGDNVYWPRTQQGCGTKITITNRFVSELEDFEGIEPYSDRLDTKRDEALICRFCGTVHKYISPRCLNPACARSNSLLPVYVLKQHGNIKRCPSCAYGGRGGTQSALRELTASTVADVHILAQDMINSEATDNRKLIVFADNRQDAAFQAAWMADHARRYRLRHMIYDTLEGSDSPQSIGDVQKALSARLLKDLNLAKAVAPEVFADFVAEAYSSQLEKTMEKFLRIAIIREFVTSFSQRESLETWGKARVMYFGLDERSDKLQQIAIRYRLRTDQIVCGIETMLDVLRRSRIFYDEKEDIFSHYWHPGAEEVQRGFLPFMDLPPKGLKYLKEEGDSPTLVSGFNSSKGETFARSFVKKWGVDKEDINDLLRDIWDLLTKDLGLLVPVVLKSSGMSPRPLAHVYQVDSSKIGVVPQDVRFPCSVCGRVHTRDTPNHACTNKNCHGHVHSVRPSEEDYNISLLRSDFEMVRAREHTAQVPAAERMWVEKEFKKQDGSINCIVATPTLELGVDIGSLDMVLLRNVPPLPSNYWQRAGRAGRRHRMAVIYTYCRKGPHDEYFFNDPMRLLSGTISPPRFNLRNPVMVEKHVHATILSEMVRTMQAEETAQDLKSRLSEALNTAFPPFISSYLFVEGKGFRDEPPSMRPFDDIIHELNPRLKSQIFKVFQDHWPKEAEMEVSEASLDNVIKSSAIRLEEQVKLLHQRMMWAITTRNKLTEKERSLARLEEPEQKLLNRCRDHLKMLQKMDLENYTLNVLAMGGYLPGYALHQGNITGFVGNAYTTEWSRLSFEISRPNTIAVRELVPGSLIYANGGKYKTGHYRLPLEEEMFKLDSYVIDLETQAAYEEGRTPDGYAAAEQRSIAAMPICDVEMAFMSHVSDEEQNRFRLPVFIVGILRDENRGEDQYRCGEMLFSHLHGQRIRLINVGPSDRVAEGNLGYPVCTKCGGTRSPYASDREIASFREMHKNRGGCNQEPTEIALTAEAQVDGLLFKDLSSTREAINLAEGIRMAASICLEMEMDDVQILMLPKEGGLADALVYDPMPGGSGLIDQMIDQWATIVEMGITSLKSCSNQCETSCYDCMRTYRNSFYHKELNRYTAIEVMCKYANEPSKLASLPPKGPRTPEGGTSTNIAELRLESWLNENGFTGFEKQKIIELKGCSIKSTKPDFYYEDSSGQKKLAIYLDGLSKDIHGSAERQRVDNLIRTYLEANGVRVVTITATSLDDPTIMDLHRSQIARGMSG